MAALDVREFRESLRRVVDEYMKLAVSATEASQVEGGGIAQVPWVVLENDDSEVKSDDSDADSEVDNEEEIVPLTARERKLAALDVVTTSVDTVFSSLLADFKHQRNTHSVLENITDEVLSRIFLFAVEGETARSKFLMTHVSRRWRALFLADSRLWTSINYIEPKPFVDECLVRARKAAIDIKYPWLFDGTSDFRTDIETVFLDRLDQIRSFSINVPSEHHPLGASFLSHGLPIATAVSVLTIADGWGSVPVVPGPLIEDLFQSNAPRLQYLAFERFGLSWNLHKFPMLTTLFLDKCYFVNPQPEADFLTMLAALPALRQLSLLDVQGLCWHGLARYDEHPIELPELQIMRLDGLRLRDTVAILSSITTPRSLRLTVKIRFDDDEPVTPLTSLRLNERLPSLDGIRDLQVDLGHNNFETFETVTLTGAPVKNGHNKTFVLGLTGNGRQFSTQIFPGACDPFDFSRLRRLVMNWRMCGWGIAADQEAPPPHDTVQDLVYFLRRCPNLEIIQLTAWMTPEVLSAFYEDTEGNVPCPKVTVLNLENSSFNDEGLKDLIRRRPTSKCARLRSLNLRGSFQFSAETVDWLREQVDEVMWDGESNDITNFETIQLS
ncbi:hypothetical protein SCHPADRAFT_999411 [Schizopora paradoxa]|uniref:F-box domain-containing protein n=1 Tax=Schizopora paradoxa TaxID=27342 RepID=A0A0H2RFK9_9AGAM|nr:hypothetical protein SCHPADRAFT_999411 [Schizopora paradoxa]